MTSDCHRRQDIPVYECDGCGACCKTFPIFAAETDDRREPRIRYEGRRLPLWLATPEWTYQLFPLPFHETCCFLNAGNRCTIYATRPDVCCGFEAGSEQCQEARRRCGMTPLEPVVTTVVNSTSQVAVADPAANC